MKTFAAQTRTGTPIPVIEVRAWAKRAMLALQIAAERRELRRLGASELDDIGLSSAAADQESARPFWDLPAGR